LLCAAWNSSGGVYVAKPCASLDPFSAKLGARKPFENVPRKASASIGFHLMPIFGEKLLPKSE